MPWFEDGEADAAPGSVGSGEEAVWFQEQVLKRRYQQQIINEMRREVERAREEVGGEGLRGLRVGKRTPEVAQVQTPSQYMDSKVGHL